MLAITLVSGTSRPAVPDPGWAYQDKLAHFMVFGLLATAWVRALRGGKRGKRGKRTRWLASVLLSTAFGALDERHQSHIPGRIKDVYDLMADLAGACVASYLYLWCSRYRRLLETRAFKTKGTSLNPP
jgi:VanZ family protein